MASGDRHDRCVRSGHCKRRTDGPDPDQRECIRRRYGNGTAYCAYWPHGGGLHHLHEDDRFRGDDHVACCEYRGSVGHCDGHYIGTDGFNSVWLDEANGQWGLVRGCIPRSVDSHEGCGRSADNCHQCERLGCKHPHRRRGDDGDESDRRQCLVEHSVGWIDDRDSASHSCDHNNGGEGATHSHGVDRSTDFCTHVAGWSHPGYDSDQWDCVGTECCCTERRRGRPSGRRECNPEQWVEVFERNNRNRTCLNLLKNAPHLTRWGAFFGFYRMRRCPSGTPNGGFTRQELTAVQSRNAPANSETEHRADFFKDPPLATY